ncbi:MAG: DUF6062 family protein [Anaerolineae bacterium]|nr:DUF6062 family protein [Thermoflexales bacterium]MDW8406727.1 DUF6062 family protein [Anaerolineae bacterium]
MHNPGRDYRTTYTDLLQALTQPDCAVCRLVNQAVRQHVDVFLYEQLLVLERRAEIRAARGFCSIHSAMLIAGHGRMLGAATLYQDVLNDVMRQLEGAVRTVSPGAAPSRLQRMFSIGWRGILRKVARIVRPQRACPLCEYERRQETVVLRALLNDIYDPILGAAFERSAGLCLPHFQMALLLPDVATDHQLRLVELERGILSTLKAELEAYIAKRNAGREAEPMGAEATAPARAGRLLAGRIVHSDGRL